MLKKYCISLITVVLLLYTLSSTVIYARPLYEDDTKVGGGTTNNSGSNTGSSGSSNTGSSGSSNAGSSGSSNAGSSGSSNAGSSEIDFNFTDKDLKNIDEAFKQVDKFFEDSQSGAMWGFGLIRDSLIKADNNSFYISAKKVSSRLTDIIKPIAYVIAFIAWLVAVGQKGVVDGDLIELKEVVKLMVSLIISLSLILLSEKICLLILGMCDEMTVKIVQSSSIDFSKMNIVYTKYESLKVIGAVPFIGPIIQTIFHLGINLSFFMYQLVLSIVSLIVNCVIIVRMIKLSIYQSLSPAFFGLGGNKSLGKYLENYLIEFIITALEIVMMAVIYVTMVGVFTSGWISGNAMLNMAFPIAMAVLVVMMLGSHKYIARLFGRS